MTWIVLTFFIHVLSLSPWWLRCVWHFRDLSHSRVGMEKGLLVSSALAWYKHSVCSFTIVASSPAVFQEVLGMMPSPLFMIGLITCVTNQYDLGPSSLHIFLSQSLNNLHNHFHFTLPPVSYPDTKWLFWAAAGSGWSHIISGSLMFRSLLVYVCLFHGFLPFPWLYVFIFIN